MVRKLIPALVLLASHFPGNVLALGVGEIHLESALNQEFDAYIDLLSVKTDELDGVKISLATPEAFERAGLDRPFILSKLRFVPEIGPKGDAVVRVTSREPIREPFLNFLIEVNWAKGRLVREYTVLLDPPVTLERKPAPVSKATTTAPAPAPAPKATPAPARQVMVSETPAAVVSEPVTAAQSEYGPVQTADTLWNIAKQVKPQGTSIHQTMIALQRSNPHAFVNNNVNNLKKGVILRIPSREEIEYLSRAEAQSAFQTQMDEWRASRSGAAVAREEAPEVSEAPVPEVTPEPEPEAVQSEGELKLASARPEGEGEEGASEGETDPERQVTRLENSLAMAQEEAESAKRENEELTSKLKALEEKLSMMEQREQLVTVRDEQLAALQAGVAQEQEAEAEAPAAAPEPEMAAREAKPAEPVKAEAPAPKAEAPAPEPEQAPRKSASGSTVDQILNLISKNQTVAMGAGGGLLVLILLLLLLKRRKSGADEFEESVLVTPDEKSGAAQQAAEELPEEEEGVGGETSLLSDFATSDMDALQDDTGEVDPVAEADVYIAYGRFQQAEELVTQAIEREPDRLSLKHKLLEVYAGAGNKDAYVKLAEEMSAKGADKADSAAWSKVLAAGAALAPAHALFAGAVGQEPTIEASDSVDAELDELATDLGLDMESESTETVSEEVADEFSDLDLDVEGAMEGLDAEAGDDEGLGDLDFDLDMGEEVAAEEVPDLGEGLSLEPESDAAEAAVGLGDLNADDLMPEQPAEAAEEPLSADDLAADLADLTADLEGADSLSLDEEPAAETEIELPDLGDGLDLGSVEGMGLDDLEVAGEASEELPDLGGLDLGEEAESEDLDQVLSGMTEGADKTLDLDEGDLEQTLSSLTDGLDLELDAETEDLEQTLSSLSGDLDLGDAGNIEDLEQTLSGFSEGLTRGEEATEGDADDLLGDLSMEGTLGEESASTQLLDEALGEDEDADEVTTKLDLAKAYVEMGDSEGARSILEEALSEGNDQQQTEAKALLDQLA